MLSDFVSDSELPVLLEGVKDVLKETYKLTDHEALSVIDQSRGKAEECLYDYMNYIESMQEMRSQLRDTLDAQFMQCVDTEDVLQQRIRNEAAVWLTFECIRHFSKKVMQGI